VDEAGQHDSSPTPIAVAAPSSAAGATGITVTVEGLIWFGLIVAAAALRLMDLDGLPLTTDEASRALDAARVAGGDVPETWRGDLVAAGTSYLFRIFGEDEFVARVIPAMAGAAVVPVLWFARPYAGKLAALVAASLVTISPLFVLYSRSATQYSAGCLLAAVMMVCLFGYLSRPRTGVAFPLVVALALAPLTDAPAVVAALAVLVFLMLESTVFANRDVRQAFRAFRSSPLQWVSALLVIAAAAQLGLTHFGTSLRADLPGVRLFADMFDLPRDSRSAEYQLALLLAYDWPILIGGAAAFLLFALKSASGGRVAVTPFERFLLVWTAVGAVTLALVTRREAGQLLILLLPLALLAGSIVQEIASRLDWSEAGKWWPLAAVAAAPIAVGALLMTEWSSGNAGTLERAVLIASPFLCLVVIAAVWTRSHAGAAVVAGGVAALVAVPFMAHSSLAAAFSDGAEPAVDARLQPAAERLRDTLEALAAERGGTIVADRDLLDELGWTLRDTPITFGGPVEGASVVLTRPDAAPPGFAGLQEVWRVAEGWYPDQVLAPRRLWRWFLYREPYGDVDASEVRIYVKTI
jgi:4-amino-4-deoxy-L-arabinose transferase-like glycosyltransferase